MKDLKTLNGAKILSKKEQKFIKGGKEYCGDGRPCHEGWCCNGTWCIIIGSGTCFPYREP